MCELYSQSDLLQLLPQLKKDLQKGILQNLSKFEVNYSFTIDKPLSNLERRILQKFFEKAAVDLTTQRGREYGFCEVEQNPYATDLTKLSKKQLDHLPTNNLDCERDLSKFDYLAKRSASSSAKNFTAKGVFDEMTFINVGNKKIEKTTKGIAKLLDKEEKLWMESQRHLKEEKIKNDLEKANQHTEYVHVVVGKCKKHQGPFL